VDGLAILEVVGLSIRAEGHLMVGARYPMERESKSLLENCRSTQEAVHLSIRGEDLPSTLVEDPLSTRQVGYWMNLKVHFLW
jgi:hypothetical protein